MNVRRDHVSLGAVHVAQLLGKISRSEKLNAVTLVRCPDDKGQFSPLIADRFGHMALKARRE